MFMAAVWLGETISGRTMIGTAAVIGGVVLTRFARRGGAQPGEA
jgi:drug/metabolite transporter (DMT)-like permease